MTHPYRNLPDRSFWDRSVADKGIVDVKEIFDSIDLAKVGIGTAGSCFAQHLGRHLRFRGLQVLDFEPPPGFLADDSNAHRWGYGIYSCRFGNIYTARQLLQLFQEAFGERTPSELVWGGKGGLFWDALRPGVQPVGYEEPESVISLRKAHLERVRELFCQVELFIFTLGLTEGWELIDDGTIFPSAPGVLAGTFDPEKYRFVNFGFQEVLLDLRLFWESLKQINSRAKMMLTVSPVPLKATGTSEHVLVANSYSKSVLRAVSGELTATMPDVMYFPSFELFTSHVAEGRFFASDRRTATEEGVSLAMAHFFGEFDSLVGKGENHRVVPRYPGDWTVVCDEDGIR